MLRANFFLKFLKYKQNTSHEITQYNSNKKFDLQDQINTKIIDIDQEISANSKALLEAQIVKLRSTFSSSNNFLEQIGKNIYKTKLDDSINWHQKQIKELYLRRRELKMNLEKLKGIFWINQIKRVLRFFLIGIFIFFSLFIFLSGFMIVIYLMPLIIIIFLVYLISNKRY
jgi:hypothetical protein